MKYNVVVIGSGPGGYTSAVRCSQLGIKTAIVERYDTFGGTCLNVGCIPAKALLETSTHFFNATKTFQDHGINTGELQLDFHQMMKRKDRIISQNNGGIQQLLKKNNVDILSGHAGFKDQNTIEICREKKRAECVTAENFIIATGSKPFSLPGIAIDKRRIITSTEALSARQQPESMIIIGAGVIGLELGSIFSGLGTKVHILEAADSILPNMDRSLSKEMLRIMKKNGIKFSLSSDVKQVINTGDKAVVTMLDNKGKEKRFEADYCLVAIGRKPYTTDLGLENILVETDKNGMIPVNSKLQTISPNIFAIGDVIRGPMLAHKASEEGILAAETIAGKTVELNYRNIPSAIYTSPEAASVGYSEEELKREGRDFRSGSCPIRALGRAHAAGKLDGFIKVIIDAQTKTLLGIHMIAPGASDMIAEATVALKLKADAGTIGGICHAHPSFSEALKEACLIAMENRSIHVPS